ncbi:methylated-DNA--[protein]-cysteine S-methyltransferase [Salinimonas lutimaris]|uniref:methylated-DNA--[protein]-cysteine S-methyltransferase n=1 Tax=Salinimonas lutimaris TaxID=914153 RepID=UPI0010BF6910|nr:methylated-DNA--[protein]-cysteine S-methyltransferase [Salinimonas lutimaris]
MFYQTIHTPCGLLQVSASQRGISAITFVQEAVPDKPGALTQQASEQLTAYFAGALTRFDLPLDAAGTAFQQAVWQQLTTIEYGHTASYQHIANAIGNPKAVRAVGMANGRNPLSIVVPCHRVIGSNGKLTGYAGGLERKAHLLKLEGATA